MSIPLLPPQHTHTPQHTIPIPSPPLTHTPLQHTLYNTPPPPPPTHSPLNLTLPQTDFPLGQIKISFLFAEYLKDDAREVLLSFLSVLHGHLKDN